VRGETQEVGPSERPQVGHARRPSRWEHARRTILGGVEAFSGEVKNDRALANQRRVIPRTVQRIDERLGLS
jgi:hypothetical protein